MYVCENMSVKNNEMNLQHVVQEKDTCAYSVPMHILNHTHTYIQNKENHAYISTYIR